MPEKIKLTFNTPEMQAFVLNIGSVANMIPDIFAQGDEAEVLLAKKLLAIVDKEWGKLVNDFDKLVDKYHDGTFGADKYPKVTRIHQPRGRKATTKTELSVVDKIFGD